MLWSLDASRRTSLQEQIAGNIRRAVADGELDIRVSTPDPAAAVRLIGARGDASPQPASGNPQRAPGRRDRSD